MQRAPEKRDVDVVIIGGGFGGMLAAVRLQEQGIDDVVIIEKGGDFGGTWYWNRYPGASCDIESYIYFPLLEETGFVPQQKYTNASETLAYCAAIAEKYALAEKALFQTEVTATEWQNRHAGGASPHLWAMSWRRAILFMPMARSTARNCPPLKALVIIRAIHFIPAAGITAIRAVHPMAVERSGR